MTAFYYFWGGFVILTALLSLAVCGEIVAMWRKYPHGE
jgi:hypothetical protein